MNFDIFNGDADGICALIQLRLEQPVHSVLITGVKRDIQLLDKLCINSGDHITVLDISLKKNCSRVIEFLNQGASCFYVDHHQSGEIPLHPNLITLINTDRAICTSLLINQYLHNKHPLWAITAAFGDNLKRSAEQLLSSLGIGKSQSEILEKLGIYINYNSYGLCIDDLFFPPDMLYQQIAGFKSPFDFIAEKPFIFEQLEYGYENDMTQAHSIKPDYQNESVAVYLLPDARWARRVSGPFGNYLAQIDPGRAIAIVSFVAENGVQISVRAPENELKGADAFCSRFPTGGGRKAAAGINHLPADQLEHFISQFENFFGTQ